MIHFAVRLDRNLHIIRQQKIPIKTNYWQKQKFTGKSPNEICPINTKQATDLEPQKPTLNLPNDSIDHSSPQTSDLGLQLIRKFSF